MTPASSTCRLWLKLASLYFSAELIAPQCNAEFSELLDNALQCYSQQTALWWLVNINFSTFCQWSFKWWGKDQIIISLKKRTGQIKLGKEEILFTLTLLCPLCLPVPSLHLRLSCQMSSLTSCPKIYQINKAGSSSVWIIFSRNQNFLQNFHRIEKSLSSE